MSRAGGINHFWELERHGDASAFAQDDGRQLSYLQAARDADLLCGHFGDGKKLVFILCENDIESNIAYLACLRSGHVPLLLNAGIESGLLEQLCLCYRPHFIWRKAEDKKRSCVYGRYTLEPLASADQTPLHRELALLLTTSGSTGSPKLVRLSYANLDSNAAAIADYLGLSCSERAITVLPMNYTYGLSVINSHLRAGARILLTNTPVIQKPFWGFFRQQEATSLVGVPYTYAMYHRLGLFKMQLPSLRYMTQAGGQQTADKVKEFAEWAQARGIRFYVMYGQTEATARMSYLPPELAVAKNASVGRAIPGGRFAILDAAGREISAAGVDGELVYHGPNVSLGYAECRGDLRKGDENRGVLETGDLARYDDDKFVYITGRLKRFIKIAGNRVVLDDLERLFHANGMEAFCGGRDDLLCIAVQHREDVARAKELVDGKLQFHFTMYRIIAVPEIPRNDAGKVQYQALFREVLHG